MAKTTIIEVADETEEQYNSELQSGDRFVIPKIRGKTKLLSRRKKEILLNKTYLNQIKILWDGLTEQEKADWKSVDPHFQQHGFRTFVADQSQRIKLGLNGVATPNQYHQDMVGKLLIEAPAEELKIEQIHPTDYFVSNRVAGKKGMTEPVEVSELFELPLKIGLSYKSNLVSTGEGSFARLYATIRHLYQGQNLSHNEIIEIPLQSHWDSADVIISTLIGQAVSYSLFIHLYKVTGNLYIDNVQAIHSAIQIYAEYGYGTFGAFEFGNWSGQNWARDPFCKKIEQVFSRGFREIPNNWTPITQPSGATFLSIYGNDEIYTASIYGLRWHGESLYGEEE